jgi:saccharopine dehydrogenase-like NADP-dependent oxidoreductase
MAWITEGKSRKVEIKTFLMSLQGSNEEMDLVFGEADVILDCLPGSQAPRIALLAKENEAHYANLTEYVAETNEIMSLASGAKTGFLLQTGIAPGYVNVLGLALYNTFKERYGVDELETMKMRVGALSQSANAPSYYAYTWSMIGVATEYVKDTIILRDGEARTVASLSGKERIIVNGEVFEDNFTSGGAANLPEALAGKVKNLDYKTLRYPGHYDWLAKSLDDLGQVDNLSKALDTYMQKHVPSVENDRIVMYGMVSGFDKNGILRSIDKSYDISPSIVGSKVLRAIQATTASALCESAYYLIRENRSGAILQTDLKSMEFLNGPYVSEIYGKFG